MIYEVMKKKKVSVAQEKKETKRIISHDVNLQ